MKTDTTDRPIQLWVNAEDKGVFTDACVLAGLEQRQFFALLTPLLKRLTDEALHNFKDRAGRQRYIASKLAEMAESPLLSEPQPELQRIVNEKGA